MGASGLLGRDDFRRLAGVACVSALVLSLCEAVIVFGAAREHLGNVGVWFLGVLLLGNWLPYVALASAALILLETTARWLLTRSRGLSWLALIGACLVAPYGLWIAHYTFSGPNIGSIAHRPAWIALGVGLICLLGAATAVWVGLSMRRRRTARAVGGLWAAVSLASLLLSASYLPNEYEPLHAGLGYLAILGATFCSRELVPGRQASPVRFWAFPALFLAISVGSSIALAQNNRLAWVVWGETPGSRYVTARLVLPADDEGEEGDVDDGAPSDSPGDHVREVYLKEDGRSAPHIFVFSVDNVQTDHVGAYGYDKRPTTPNIDRLAQSGVLFRRAYSYEPQTRVFMTSMLLGRRIPNFGAHRPPEKMKELALTRLLKKRDYYTLVKGVFELTKYRKFQPSDYLIDTNIERETAEIIRESKSMPHIPYQERFKIIDAHLASADGRPVFVWIHLLGPHWHHGSFYPSEDFAFGRGLDARYDSAIAGTDQWLGRLQKMAQRRLGNDRDIYWIVQSDHGAGLLPGATGAERGKSLHERYVHVPLVIAGPRMQPGEVDVHVDSALDVAATIVDLAGIQLPATYDGLSLVPLFENGTAPEEFSDRIIPLRNSSWTGAVQGNWKYIRYRGVDQLFHLSQDPQETRNLADQERKVLSRLRSSSRRQLRRASKVFN
jgi:arylsulfatase A-like enzyme